jgi:hypothetical protein
MIIESKSSMFILRRDSEDCWLAALVWHPRLECWLPLEGTWRQTKPPRNAASARP